MGLNFEFRLANLVEMLRALVKRSKKYITCHTMPDGHMRPGAHTHEAHTTHRGAQAEYHKFRGRENTVGAILGQTNNLEGAPYSIWNNLA